MPVIDRPDIAVLVNDELRTPRLRLRRPGPEDVAPMTRLACDYAISCMTTRMPYPYAETDARQFVELVGRQDRRLERTFVIERDGVGFVGAIGFHQPAGAPLEMGYWIGRPYWGQGLASEAACAAMRWADDDWGRRTMVAGHFVDNPASARVLIKAGFLYTGEPRRAWSRARRAEADTRMMVWLA